MSRGRVHRTAIRRWAACSVSATAVSSCSPYMARAALEPNIYVVTGGAIKLTRTMQEREHTTIELEKLNRCKAYLQSQGVFDKDSFVELTYEED